MLQPCHVLLEKRQERKTDWLCKKEFLLTDFLSWPSEWKEMLSILSGTLNPDLVEEMVEEEDLLDVERMSEN